MFVCKACGYQTPQALEFCPRCKKRIEFSKAEIEELVLAFSEAVKNREYESVVQFCKILAEAGHTDSEREYGRMLEKGELVLRDYDEAMKFFMRAAKKNEPYSAYRYSRLVSRGNERAGNFWLLYSAYLGCPEAYPKAAELLSKGGFENDANHFYLLAAQHDDVDSIVELAARHYKGIGMPPSAEYAKWYMDKLSFPPLFSLKLAYKLKGVIPREPDGEIYDCEPFVTRLSGEAAKCGFKEAYFTLIKKLSELGRGDSMTVLGTLLADGEGCEKNVGEAIRVFTEAASLGSYQAYMCLAELFRGTDGVGREPELVKRYLEAAGKLGCNQAYAELGELYLSGELFEKDYKMAEFYFRRASDGGINEAGVKADEIASAREKFYKDGVRLLSDNAEKAFKAFAISAAMGYVKAPMKLAECYLKGVGVKADRKAAFYWYRTAVDFGDERAYYPLGLCYFGGIGVNRDLRRAKSALMRAASIGSDGAKVALKQLYEARASALAQKLYSRGMRLIYQKKFVEAKQSFELAVELKSKKSNYALGCIYEFGLGLACDRQLAAKFYDDAYKLGFVDKNSKYKKIILKLIR